MKKALSLLLALSTLLLAQDIAGTYTGTLTAETPEGGQGGPATVVIRQEGPTLSITAGPQPDQQRPASKVIRTGNQLKFEIHPPGDVPRTMSFVLILKDGRLTGDVTLTQEGETRRAKLDVTKD